MKQYHTKQRVREHTCNGMRRYRDEQEAKQALRRLRTSTRLVAPGDWFYCDNCGGIHAKRKGS